MDRVFYALQQWSIGEFLMLCNMKQMNQSALVSYITKLLQ